VALKDDLISVWELNEASGNALDSHGSNDATETGGTIGAASGPAGLAGARDFEAGDTEWFTVSDNTDLSTGNIDFSLSAWVNAESLAATMWIAGKWLTTGNNREYSLVYNSGAGRLTFRISNDGTAVIDTNWSSGSSTATWYFLAGGHNATANDAWVSVNAGTPVTTSHSTGVKDGTSAFHIGSRDSPADYWDGLVAQVALWKRDIRSDLAELYAAGSGLPYSSWDGGGGGDPEGSLIGGKLIRGGLLLHGVLGR
jgi:hypothetical protein